MCLLHHLEGDLTARPLLLLLVCNSTGATTGAPRGH